MEAAHPLSLHGVPIVQVLGIFDTFAVKQQTLRQPKTTPTNTRAEVFSNESWKGLKFHSTKS